MKIKKGYFSTEIEITPKEMEDLWYQSSFHMKYGLFVWLKRNFDLDFMPKPIKDKK